MKKNLYIANLLVAGLMTFTGCTDGFESDNANKAGRRFRKPSKSLCAGSVH